MKYIEVMGKCFLTFVCVCVFFFFNFKMCMKYRHSKGMSEEMGLGNLRRVKVYSITCMREIFHHSKNVVRRQLPEGNL